MEFIFPSYVTPFNLLSYKMRLYLAAAAGAIETFDILRVIGRIPVVSAIVPVCLKSQHEQK